MSCGLNIFSTTSKIRLCVNRVQVKLVQQRDPGIEWSNNSSLNSAEIRGSEVFSQECSWQVILSPAWCGFITAPVVPISQCADRMNEAPQQIAEPVFKE